MLKKVGVVVNKDRDIGYNHTKIIIDALYYKGFTPIVSPEVKRYAGHCAVASSNIYKDSDFIICVGGDGTFLSTARAAYEYRIPILGINRGSVGFLAEVETSDIQLAVEKMACGKLLSIPDGTGCSRYRDGETVFRDIAINVRLFPGLPFPGY